ncbi:thioredoxin domain-containing protein [Francisella philomiragia]
MRRFIISILSVFSLMLSSCANQQVETKPTTSVDNVISTKSEDTRSYAEVIAIPMVMSSLLDDKSTPRVGPRNAKKAVVVFFDYACGKCAQISKEINKLIKENPDTEFIFKAYPSLKRDAKVANYATLVADEAYLQGGSELFLAYNKTVFSQRETSGRLTNADVDNAVKRLGIKVDNAKLKKKAATEELETRKLGKLIGFHGPHTFIVLPTDLANMSAEQLEGNTGKIYVISDKQTNSVTNDYQAAAKWSASKIQTQLKNMK